MVYITNKNGEGEKKRDKRSFDFQTRKVYLYLCDFQNGISPNQFSMWNLNKEGHVYKSSTEIL